MKRPPPKRRGWNSTLPAPTSSLPRRTRLAKVGKQKARRIARQHAFYQSAAWRGKPDGIRWRTFLHDDFTCTCGCGWRDETRTGRGLQAHHQKGSMRFGGDEIAGEDTTTRRTDHHMENEAELRPWNVGRLGRAS